MTTTKYTLSESDKQTYGDAPIYHIFVNDKYADLPLLIKCENGKKAIIPTLKSVMRCVAPEYFKIFYDKDSNFKESKHEDGSIYSMTIPGLTDPAFVLEYIEVLHLDFDISTLSNVMSFDANNCFEYLCISKFWQNDDVSKQIIKFVEENQQFELLPKAVYQYNFSDFDDFIDRYVIGGFWRFLRSLRFLAKYWRFLRFPV